jgi:DNA modification methylase
MHQVANESVDLIYLDPPFFSNKNYEIVWGNGYELKAYEDRWKGGIENYIAWMEPPLRECHRVLKPTGSLYLHCDWHANAHLRILLDTIFGEMRFLNEIVWCYRTGGATKKRFSRKHDNIFFYSKSGEYTFNSEKERVYYDKPFFCDQKDEQGRYYADVLPVDFWEIPAVINVSKERLGYPTQKPEALLERIIRASSNEGDIVLDPMAGGGTTVAVAQRLKRKWIAIDVSPLACKMMSDRLRKLGVTPRLLGMPMSIKALKALQPFVFQQWVVDKLYGHPSPKKVGDMGIDGFLMDGRPLQVKQSEGVGRPKIDEFETALRRLKKAEGVVVGFSFTKGAQEEVARIKNHEGMTIELKTVRQMLEDMGAHDEELEAIEWKEGEKE